MAAEFPKWIKAGQDLGYERDYLKSFVKERRTEAKEEKIRRSKLEIKLEMEREEKCRSEQLELKRLEMEP